MYYICTTNNQTNKLSAMCEIILTWLIGNWPALAIAIVVGIIVWFVARFYYKEFKPIEKSVGVLPCDSRGKLLEEIKESLAVIRTYITTTDPKRASIFSQKASPRKLNTAGNQLLDSCAGIVFIENNKTLLFEWLDKKNPKTALDVEKSALEILIENIDNDIFNSLKNWVYNSPSMKVTVDGEAKELAVSLQDVCFVISLPLRDAYLQKHPEL